MRYPPSRARHDGCWLVAIRAAESARRDYAIVIELGARVPPYTNPRTATFSQGAIPQLRDPADEMVLETALNGRAHALLTLNIGDFAAAAHFRLPVMTPGAFLRQLNEEQV